MQPIQINVQVNIGLTSDLFTLISSVLNRPAQLAELPAATAQRQKKPEKQQPKPEVENQQADAPKPEPKQAQRPEPAPEPVKQEPDVKPKEYTEVDVRAAMDRTRRRIEGDNYKEKPDSEGYKKWHRTLTGWFKNTAAICGAEKPSALPDSESRARFIACCDAVKVENDELVEDCPF